MPDPTTIPGPRVPAGGDPGTAPEDRTLAADAAAAVELLASRLVDPAAVARTADRDDNREPIHGASAWSPVALSHGHPGVATLFAELGRGDGAWLPLAHRHVAATGAQLASWPAGGLHAGPASLLAATQTAAAAGAPYVRLRGRLTAWLVDDHRTRLEAVAAGRAAGGRGTAWEEYDVVCGLSGTLRLLLDAEDAEGDDHGVAAAVDATLAHLAALAAPLCVDGEVVPGWWVPGERQPVPEDREAHPRGDCNAGLAHGIAGPLSVLAAAVLRGRELPGQREAMATMAGWLIDRTLHDDDGPYWPCRVPWEHQVGPAPDAAFTRAAWCYGAPGVCLALLRAGVALDVPAWCDAAVAGLRSVVRRDDATLRLDGPTICHGHAGVAQVLHRAHQLSGDPELAAGRDHFARRTLGAIDPDAPFGVRHLVPDSPDGWRSATGYRGLDVAGLLEGAAGVACALLPIADEGYDDGGGAAWDRCLALA